MEPKSHQIISSLSEVEMDLLEKYIELEPSIRNCEYVDLMKIYHNATINSENLSKKEIFRKLYPTEAYSDSKLRLVQSDLTKIVERFIVYLSLNDDSEYFKKQLLYHFKTKGLRALYTKQLRKYNREKVRSEKPTTSDSDLFIAEAMYENAMENREEGREVTQRLLNKLDHQYILKKLRYSCLVRSQENVYNFEFDHGLKDEILHYIDRHCLHEDPAIGTYYHCFKMLGSKSKTVDFDLFYEYLQKYNPLFSEEMNAELYTLAINFCIRSLNQGDKLFGQMGLKFYTDGIDMGILLSNGQISRFTFRNIVTMAIRINEFDQAEAFISSYQHLLTRSDKKNMIHFTTALVLFSQRNYDMASDELLKVRFKDLLFNLAAKGLQLKIYYETNEFLVLQSHLDAMQIFLKRHKALGYHKQNYLNVIALTRKLMNAKSAEKIAKLKLVIDSEKSLTDRIWFQEKVAELEI